MICPGDKCQACGGALEALPGALDAAGSILWCPDCGDIITADSGRRPSDADISTFLEGQGAEAFRTFLVEQTRAMAERTGDAGHADAFFSELWGWFSRKLPEAYRPLLAPDGDVHQIPVAVEPNAWLEFRGRLMRAPDAFAPNTLKAYGKDFTAFRNYCATRKTSALPASVDILCEYLKVLALDHAYSTIQRACAAIAKVHILARAPDPSKDPDVQLVLRGLRRRLGVRPKQRAPIRLDAPAKSGMADLRQLLEACPDTLVGLRDRALFSLGFDVFLRAEELLAVRADQLAFDIEGRPGEARLLVARAKNDPAQEGSYRFVSVEATADVRKWMEAAGITEGWLFRQVHRSGRVQPARISRRRMAQIVKEAAARAGFPAEIIAELSTHSFRIGAAQTHRANGVELEEIMTTFGWTDIETARRYVENVEVTASGPARLLREKRGRQIDQ